MVNRKQMMAGIAGLVLCVAIFLVLFPSEQKRIKKQLHQLSGMVAKNSQESIAGMAIKTHQLSSLFASQCTLQVSDNMFSGIFSGTEIASNIVQARLQVTAIKLAFYDVQVEVQADEAQATCTAQVEWTSQSGERGKETREIVCRLRKTGGQWLFCLFKAVNVLEK